MAESVPKNGRRSPVADFGQCLLTQSRSAQLASFRTNVFARLLSGLPPD
jgi:hypothetical protein